MTKKNHDEVAASNRTIQYDKTWFIAALRALQETGLEKFRMLDMGCGNGEFSEIVRDKFDAQITCLDYSETHLKRANELGFEVVKCDFDRSEDIENVCAHYAGKFDVIVSLEVIEHIFDIDAYLTTAHNLLKSDGILIISTPNMDFWAYRIYSMFRGNVPVGEGHHIRFFDSQRLKQALILDGFEGISSYCSGNTDYCFERTITERPYSMRNAFVSVISFISRYCLSVKSSMYYSSLVFLAKKSEIEPIGFDPAMRAGLYGKLSVGQKKKCIDRLLPLRKSFFFDEHPGLRKFIDSENDNLGV